MLLNHPNLKLSIYDTAQLQGNEWMQFTHKNLALTSRVTCEHTQCSLLQVCMCSLTFRLVSRWSHLAMIFIDRKTFYTYICK